MIFGRRTTPRDGDYRGFIGQLPPDADARFVELHDYWQSLRPGPGLLPPRRDFDPSVVPKLLPWIWLIDVLRDPIRFRYRLLGTGQVLAMGGELKGQFVHEAFPAFIGSVTEGQHVEVARSGAIAYLECPAILSKPDGNRRATRLLLPFAPEDQVVDIIMGLCIYSDLDSR